MSDEANRGLVPSLAESMMRGMKGAFGAGLVLIVLPSAALIFWLPQLEEHAIVGLPLLAIFGIMILFGAMALISSLFAGLNLSCESEALALPPGSVRAAIALALIVLFALISVMLYQSLSRPYKVENLSLAQKTALLQEPRNIVLSVLPEPCKPAAPVAASGPAGAASVPAADAAAACTGMLFTVHLRQPPGTEAADLAKQLLILIGTLMTSVTSFYFASRSTEANTKAMLAATLPPPASAAPAAPAAAVAGQVANTGG